MLRAYVPTYMIRWCGFACTNTHISYSSQQSVCVALVSFCDVKVHIKIFEMNEWLFYIGIEYVVMFGQYNKV